MAERKGGDGVKVVDRRTAAEPPAEPAAERTPARDKAAAERAPGAEPVPPPAGAERDATCDEPIPEIDFVTFVLSLSTNAMVSLGLLARPDTTEKSRDLPLARQTIDILALLQEKTKGNLSGEEERILDSVLYDLRMTYVQVVREHC
jgi:hypothetical protein